MRILMIANIACPRFIQQLFAAECYRQLKKGLFGRRIVMYNNNLDVQAGHSGLF